MHTALWPYRKTLLELAASNGSPPLRYMFYDHGDEPATWRLDEQFMLGAALF